VTRYTLAAAAGFGLEAVVRAEVEGLGIAGARAEDRRVLFEGTPLDAARCNVRLRTADRVLVLLAQFACPGFDELYEGMRSIDWEGALGRSPAVTIEARTARSKLAAVPSIQSVSKKALIDAVARGKAHGRVAETGPSCTVEVSLRDDRASVWLDTTGPGLHRRGYRTEAGEAPLRENLAASLVLLSRWDPSRPFADPLCGSGTIAIEAAMIAAGVAPGLGRTFAGEGLPLLPARAWEHAREEARAARLGEPSCTIHASDRDPAAIAAAKRNAGRAGVAGLVRFQAADLAAFRPAGEHGCMVVNPPYGERLGSAAEAETLYRDLGRVYTRIPTWSLFALTAHPQFERAFGARATKNRKLYNGNLRCWLYQYFGPLPPR
jgi:putative N6-adenine-specific DNA methylase